MIWNSKNLCIQLEWVHWFYCSMRGMLRFKLPGIYCILGCSSELFVIKGKSAYCLCASWTARVRDVSRALSTWRSMVRYWEGLVAPRITCRWQRVMWEIFIGKKVKDLEQYIKQTLVCLIFTYCTWISLILIRYNIWIYGRMIHVHALSDSFMILSWLHFWFT